MQYVAVALLVAAYLTGWVGNALGLPGNWLMVLAVAIYAAAVPDDSAVDISWPIVVANVGLAALGELAETLAAAWGIGRRGGSRRAAVWSVLGSLAGAILGAGVGIPIPIIGSLVGVVLGAGLGAFAGALLAESSHGRTLADGVHVGWGAFWGRLWGTATKVACSTAMLGVTFTALAIALFGALARR